MISIILICSLAALAINQYYIMPSWYYKYFKFKPFNCLTCSNFWMALMASLIAGHYYMAPMIALASVGLSINIIKLTEK
jgi:hypothetical protein